MHACMYVCVYVFIHFYSVFIYILHFSDFNISRYSVLSGFLQAAPDMTLPHGASVSVTQYSETCRKKAHILLDVRSKCQFEMISFYHYSNLNHVNQEESEQIVTDKVSQKETQMEMEMKSCQDVPSIETSLSHSISNNVHLLHFPLSELKGIHVADLKKEILCRIRAKEKFRDFERTNRDILHGSDSSNSSGDRILGDGSNDEGHSGEDTDSEIGMEVFCVCRRGVDSVLATQILHGAGINSAFNITGGLTAWSSTVDPLFPMY